MKQESVSTNFVLDNDDKSIYDMVIIKILTSTRISQSFKFSLVTFIPYYIAFARKKSMVVKTQKFVALVIEYTHISRCFKGDQIFDHVCITGHRIYTYITWLQV